MEGLWWFVVTMTQTRARAALGGADWSLYSSEVNDLASDNALAFPLRFTNHSSPVGYRHIDCASVYGNQKLVGEGLADFVKEVCARAFRWRGRRLLAWSGKVASLRNQHTLTRFAQPT